MIRKLQYRFALTEKGAKDLIKATLLTVFANITLMVPVCLLILVLRDMIQFMENGREPGVTILIYTLMAVLIGAVIYGAHWVQY